MFTEKELQALSVILQRANITGKEALMIVMLQQKVGALLEPKEEGKKVVEDKKKDVIKKS